MKAALNIITRESGQINYNPRSAARCEDFCATQHYQPNASTSGMYRRIRHHTAITHCLHRFLNNGSTFYQMSWSNSIPEFLPSFVGFLLVSRKLSFQSIMPKFSGYLRLLLEASGHTISFSYQKYLKYPLLEVSGHPPHPSRHHCLKKSIPEPSWLPEWMEHRCLRTQHTTSVCRFGSRGRVVSYQNSSEVYQRLAIGFIRTLWRFDKTGGSAHQSSNRSLRLVTTVAAFSCRVYTSSPSSGARMIRNSGTGGMGLLSFRL